MDVIGFLAPDGKIYNCTSWNHADLAERLCKSLASVNIVAQLQ